MKIQFLLFCILIILSQALWAKQSSLSFNEIKALHYKSALHWADREMARLINEGKQQNTSDSLLGEYYKQRALIALDASYPMQYKRWVDSMYFYKAKLNKPIYFVEYATYQLRAFAWFQNAGSAFDLINRAKAVFKANRQQAHLIDAIFFHLNVLNTYRNGFESKEGNHHLRKWRLMKKHDELPFEKQEDPHKRYLYYRFMGNMYQDFVFERTSSYNTTYSDTALKKSIDYYQKAIACFANISPNGNDFTAMMKVLIALQYIKNKANYTKAKKWIKSAESDLVLSIDHKVYFRNVGASSFLYKLYANVALYDSNFEERQYIINRLESLWKLRMLYRNNFFSSQPNLYFHAYASFPEDELFKLYALQLNEKSKHPDSLNYASKIWEKYSVRFSWEAYFEATKRTVGEQLYDSLSKELNNLQEEQMLVLDQISLSKNEVVQSKLNNQLDSLEMAFDLALDRSPKIFRNYQKGMAQQSLPEFQSTLYTDEAFVLYCISRPFNMKKSGFQYALIIKQDEFKLVRLNQNLLFGKQRIKNNSAQWKAQSFSDYNRFFAEFHEDLKGLKRVKIGLNPFVTKINFEQLIPDTAFSSIKEAKFLIKEFAFSYTQNQSVDYLNGMQLSSFEEKPAAVSLNLCDSNQFVGTPFTTKFGLQMAESLNATLIKNKDDFFESSKYSYLIVLNHGKLDSLLKFQGHYLNQSSLFKNEILLCDSSINLKEVDRENLAAELVILANCNSGLGLNASQSGRYDFAPVFIKNGSASVITTNFEVDDFATAKILEQFWENYQNGQTLSIALQNAKLSFLEKVEDPEHYKLQYWSGLRLDGLDQKIQKSSFWFSIKELSVAFSVLISLVFFGLYFRKR